MTDEPLTRAVERAEDLLKFNSQGGLARLSEETGGFLIRDTNDLRSAFQRIDEDIRFHYLLTYAPTSVVPTSEYVEPYRWTHEQMRSLQAARKPALPVPAASGAFTTFPDTPRSRGEPVPG